MTTPDNFSLNTKVGIVPVDGEPGVFNFVQKDRKCSRKFISVKEDCDVDLVDLWNKDDFSGRQRFKAIPVPGREDVYAFEVGGRPGCATRYISAEPNNGTLVLKASHDHVNQWFRITGYNPYNPREVVFPTEVLMTPQGYTNGIIHIGTGVNKCLRTHKLAGLDDEDFQPVWRFVPVPEKKNVFNIIAPNRCSMRFLAVHEACDNVAVDLWNRDDKSGKQQWIIEHVEGREGAYTIRAGGRKNCPVSYLSLHGSGEKLVLSTASGSISHFFGIVESSFPPITVIPSCSHINSMGKLDSNTRLAIDNKACDDQSYLHEPAIEYTESGQEWYFKHVPGKINTFNIVMKSKTECRKKYLSVGGECDQHYVDMWYKDDGSGRQQWTANHVPGFPGRITFTAGGRSGCDRVHLSTKDVWNRVDLWSSTDDDNQHFAVEKCYKPLPKIKFPKCGTIKNLGKQDNVNYLGLSTVCNDHQAYLYGSGYIDKKESQGNWNMIPVEGKKNVFNIMISEKRGDCSRQYLSVAASCGAAYVDVWHRDDQSGRQQWLAEHVEGLGNGYTFRPVGRTECDRVYLSTQTESDRVELSATNDDSM